MNLFKLFFLSISISTLIGCSAAGVSYSSDPYQKLQDAYGLMNSGRAIPAENLGNEALASFTKSGDTFGMADSHIFLGQFYKHKTYRDNEKFYTDHNEYDPTDGKSIYHSQKAVDLFLSIENYTQAAKATFALANGYIDTDTTKSCQLYDESMNLYKKGKIENPGESFWINPVHESYEGMISGFKKKYCAPNA